MIPKIDIIYLAILIWGFNILFAPIAYFLSETTKLGWFVAFIITAILLVYTLFIIRIKEAKLREVKLEKVKNV